MNNCMITRPTPRARVALLLSALVPAALICLAAGSIQVRVAAGPITGGRPSISLPRAAEHRYRVAAKIRPLLLFWVGPDNVGSARLTWYRGDGVDRGFEMLLGSDPARAPRGINRWGYVTEETRGGEASITGVMKQSDEASLEEAKSRIESEQSTGFFFKMIREKIAGGESVAQVTTARVGRDYSYRELDPLLGEFGKITRPPQVKRTRVDADVRPGLLSTISAVVHEDAEARRRSPQSRGIGGRVTRFAYNAKIYTLTLASSQFLGSQQYGGRTYARLVRNDFEITMKGFTWREKFTLVYSLDGADAELPVFVSYQPRWWFKAELCLDETQQF